MSQAEPIDVEPEEKPVEARAEAEVDVKAIPVRSDLPVGHWLRDRRAARVVWSGETDQVVIGDKLVAVRDAAALAEAEKPVEEPKPIEPGDEEPDEEEIRVR